MWKLSFDLCECTGTHTHIYINNFGNIIQKKRQEGEIFELPIQISNQIYGFETV